MGEAVLRVSKTEEGAMNQGTWPLEARKGMEVDSTLELLEGNSPARTSVLMQ